MTCPRTITPAGLSGLAASFACAAALLAGAPRLNAQRTASQQTATQPAASAANSSAANLSDDELVAAVASSLGPAGVIPRDRGFNASLISTSQHDSINGWSSLVTPSLAYRFNRYVSADVATPIFLYLCTVSTTSVPPGPTGSLTSTSQVQHGIVADTFLALHVHTPAIQAGHRSVLNTVTALLIAPTGSVTDGVGAGKTTWNVTDRLELASRYSPYIGLGVGSSSRVLNQRLQQNQTSRGVAANFAAGARFYLPRGLDFAAEAYEQLPIGDQKVSLTQPRPGDLPSTGQQTVSAGLAENNGFNTVLDIPVAPHLTLSGFYSRSLRQHEDIAGFSLTFLLHDPSHQ